MWLTPPLYWVHPGLPLGNRIPLPYHLPTKQGEGIHMTFTLHKQFKTHHNTQTHWSIHFLSLFFLLLLPFISLLGSSFSPTFLLLPLSFKLLAEDLSILQRCLFSCFLGLQTCTCILYWTTTIDINCGCGQSHDYLTISITFLSLKRFIPLRSSHGIIYFNGLPESIPS